MAFRLIDAEQQDALRTLVNQSRNIVIVCHRTPDGDALGSSLCLWHLLRAMGYKADVVVPDAPPELLRFLPGVNDITINSYDCERASMLLKRADLIFCLDINDLKRLDRMESLVESSSAKRIVIDHHLNPSIEADIIISHPEISSTCALLYRVIDELGLISLMSHDSAECCCAGMMTDTGNFSYNSNDPELYRILAVLLEKGVDKDALYTKLFNTNSETRVRIMGYGQSAKMQLFYDHCASLIAISRDELDEFDYHRGDTEALVNVPLSIPGVVYSVFLREDEPGFVKVSMRSKGEFSVKEICEAHFGGGGHRNAAGGEMFAPLPEVVDKVLSIMPLYDRYLPRKNSDSQIK